LIASRFSGVGKGIAVKVTVAENVRHLPHDGTVAAKQKFSVQSQPPFGMVCIFMPTLDIPHDPALAL